MVPSASALATAGLPPSGTAVVVTASTALLPSAAFFPSRAVGGGSDCADALSVFPEPVGGGEQPTTTHRRHGHTICFMNFLPARLGWLSGSGVAAHQPFLSAQHVPLP